MQRRYVRAYGIYRTIIREGSSRRPILEVSTSCKVHLLGIYDMIPVNRRSALEIYHDA